MKLFKKLIFIFLSIGALISCDGMDATYKEFIEEGPIVYIGKVDSLKAYAGRNRVMLEWQKLLDPRAKTAKIFWENRTKSTELQLTDKATLTQVVVEDLAEGMSLKSVHTIRMVILLLCRRFLVQYMVMFMRNCCSIQK